VIGYLGLGSNVGDRRANLQRAIGLLPARGVSVLASSSIFIEGSSPSMILQKTQSSTG